MEYFILVAAVILTVCYDVHVQANYVLNVTLLRWENPNRAEYDLHCCDTNGLSHPNDFCPYQCNTRMDICLQPDTFPNNSLSCPYGRYFTMYDNTLSNPDDITFIPGVNIKGDVPNPMTFNVPTNNTLRLFVSAYDDDFEILGSSSEFVDIVRFTISPTSSISRTSIEKTGQYGVGTLMISYTVYCPTGYCGDYCQFHCDQTSTSDSCTQCTVPTTQCTPTVVSSSTGNTAGLPAVSVLLVICFVALVVFIIIAVVILQKKIQELKKFAATDSKMAPVDTTGNIDKHIFVQRLNSSSQTASIKRPLPKLPEKEEICKSIPDHTYPKDAVFVPPAVSNNNPISHMHNNPISKSGGHMIDIDNNPCYSFNADDTKSGGHMIDIDNNPCYSFNDDDTYI